MLTTGLCETFGISVPIWNAGMGGGLAGVDLAAAVSGAGGLGVLGLGGLPTGAIVAHVRDLRARTDRPFAVNLIMPLMPDDAVQCCLDEGVPTLILFWGDPAPYVEAAHAAGTRVVVQVGSVEQARAAAAAGVDAVMLQGIEAGGHNLGTGPLAAVLPATVEAVAPTPVIAAGGIADAHGLLAALDLGAQAVSLGTRFLCSDESLAAPAYKQRIVAAGAQDTVLTTAFDLEWPDAPHRVLRNRVTEAWQPPGPGGSPARHSIAMPLAGFDGDLDDQALYCGQSCAVIDDVRPAAEIVRSLVDEAEAQLRAR